MASTDSRRADASTRFRFPGLLLASAGALVLAGCLSPQRAARDADKTAYSIIDQKQKAALGTTRPFTLNQNDESPEDQLRRKLLLSQQLPAAGPASYGRAFLPPVPKQPDGVTNDEPLPVGAAVVPSRDVKVAGLNTPTFATDLALVQIGSDPGDADLVGRYVGPQADLVLGPRLDEVRPEPLMLSLVDALQVAAKNNRAYQTRKEAVFLTALALDLERDRFEFRFAGTIDADIQSELEGDDTAGVVLSPSISAGKLFKSGALLSTRIGLDLSKLLSGDESESLGLFADTSVTIPLLRGAGVEVVAEPLQQAERDAVYAIWDFERFKRTFAVSVATQYFSVLQTLDAISNSEANYERLRYTASRSRAFFEEGKLPGIQVDQAITNELVALERLILAQQRYESRLDQFKLFLGLPPDASIALDRNELNYLTPLAERVIGPSSRELLQLFNEEQSGDVPAGDPLDPLSSLRGVDDPATQSLGGTQADRPSEDDLPEPGNPDEIERDLGVQALAQIENPYDAADKIFRREAIRIALANRLDLSIAIAEVNDAQRQVVVAADGLEGIFDLTAGANVGSSRGVFSGGLDNDTDLNFSDGSYSGGIRLDLPIERTAERNAYRAALIRLDQVIRDAQEFEDIVKIDILEGLRNMRVASENLRIQAQAIAVADRRVQAANLLLDLGRGEVRDVTEAEDALIDAQNGFTEALIDFYLSELELQSDLGVLEVDHTGLYTTVLDLFNTGADTATPSPGRLQNTPATSSVLNGPPNPNS